MYMDKDLMEDRFYQIKDQFNQRKITPEKFYSNTSKQNTFIF